MARDFSKAFYKSKQWQDVRQYVLLRDFNLCVRCGNAAEEVHHIIRLTPKNIRDPLVALNPDNLESLCHDCHAAEHSRIYSDPPPHPSRKGRGVDSNISYK